MFTVVHVLEWKWAPDSYLRQLVADISAEIKRQYTTKRETAWRRPTGHPFSDILLVSSLLVGLSSQLYSFRNILISILKLIKIMDADSY